ncbi:trigger factor [Ruminococcaceae bacterium KH2T8]|nr:trigger factor [Ruminococcaceae bacterium KH2T8]
MATIEKKENSQVQIALEASREEFAAALQKSYNKNKKRFQVPGFRRGKVPYQLVVKYYGEGVLYEDAIDEIVNPAYSQVVKENDLQVVSRPELDVQEIGEDGLKYTLTVTVKPEVKLGKYEGVEVPYSKREVTDETIDAEIERMRKRNSTLENVEDRAAQNGDTVVIDYEGFKDGVAFEGGKGESYSLKLGSGSFIPGFEDQVVGHNVGEEFSIEVKFPEEYHAEELKGADATFNVKIHNIKAEILPELDDEFVKDVSEFDTLAELKADIKKNQEEAAEKEAKNIFINETLKVVADNAEVEIPSVMVDNEVENMAQEQASRMSQQGIELDMYLQYMGQNMDQFKQSLRPMAEIRVKNNLVIEAVSKELKMEATAEEYDKEIEQMAKAYNMDKADIAKALGEDNPYIKENIVSRKTVEYLADKAVKTEPKAEEKTEEKKAEKKPAAKKTTAKKAAAKKDDASEEKAEKKPAAKKTTKKTAAKKDDEAKTEEA